MAEKKYLDSTGLIRLVAHLIDKFAMKKHSHDDIYYTETEIDTKVAELQAGIDGHTHSWNDLEDKPFDSVSTEIPLIEIEDAYVTYHSGPISDYDIKLGDPVRARMIINSEEVVIDSVWGEGMDGDDGFFVEDYEKNVFFEIRKSFSNLYEILWIDYTEDDVRVDQGTTMRIYALSEGVVPLDAKYLPDTVATNSEVDAALATKADTTHTHAIADVTNLQTTLDSLQSSIDSVDGAVDNIASGTVVVKEAEHAESADSATTATTATNANHASTADSATSATTASKVSKTMTVQLNSGTTEGTNKFTYNGSAAKSINITPSSIGAQVAGNYAASSHTHDDRYYTESEIDSKLAGKSDTGHGHNAATTSAAGFMSADDKSKLDGIAAGAQKNTITGVKGSSESTYRTGNVNITAANIGLGNVNNTSDANKPVSTAQQAAIDSAEASAKSYADGIKNDLLNGAGTAYDTLKELGDLIDDNADAIDALESVAASKANASDLTSHTGNTTVHITATERTNWNAAKTHADSAHAPSNAEKNQNAFSNVVVGSTTIAADTTTDSLTLAGSNVTITPDATNDKVTIGITKANVTSALGYTPPTTNTTYSNATTSAAGLMSASDKSKLDGIASGANAYTHPTTAGNKHIPAGGSSGQILRWSADGTAVWGNDNNTTYNAATQSAAGLMSAADKTKLDGIASGANNYTYTLPTASSSTLGGVKTTSTVTNNSGYTACPIISGVPYYKDTNTTYSLSSFGVTATAAELNKLDGCTATVTELNYVDGVTSNIQTQLDGKAAASHGNHVPTTQTANNAVFLRNDNTWATVTPANIGAATSGHTHSNMVVKLNGGSTEGTNLFTYNGGAAKTINITPASIGAQVAGSYAAASHTHNYAGSSSAGGAATSANKLATARTISLTGDVTGSVSFDGSADKSITATVADNSHNHTIANVTNLQSTLDSKFNKSGGTVTGATTFNSTVTIGSAILSYDSTEEALVISFA